ncbi:hypothetical protein RND59_15120 [Vibrio ruber]|uniref:hypothetical protein n=1 Tax=Vibrio ruber TaxID=184755 RepID=UPI0028931432|nr:hypothetical protein [Vibrio ruber]WNJ95434.1 hypothetical protein RND59_15120 [Vibrio ruber]
MKPIYIKRVVDFIHRYHPEYTGRQLNAILEDKPEQFVYLLNEAIERSGSTPKCAIKFIKELQKIIKSHKAETQPSTKENTTMEKPNKPAFIMRLVIVAKNVWGGVTKFFTTNAKKAAVTGTAIAMAVVAYFATNKTALLSLLAVIKGQSVINSLKSLWTKVQGLAVSTKNFLRQNVELLWIVVQLGATKSLEKASAAKNFVVTKAKQAWSWMVNLFTSETDDEHQCQAA